MLDVFADAFEVDGSLRDLVVVDTSIEDWLTIYEELRSKNHDLTFECGDSQTLPPSVRELLVRGPHDQCPSLSLKMDANTLNCHFYQTEEIEFDLDPRDISTEANFFEITDFMRKIGKLLSKDVIITEENQHDLVFIRYRHEQDDIVAGPRLNTRQP
jgi:hypothetical protein